MPWEQADIRPLVLLDIMLPEEDGPARCLQKLRDAGPDNPASAGDHADGPQAREFDKVAGLDCGADDDIAKPFGMMELVSRVAGGAAPYRAGNRRKILADRQPVCPARTAYCPGRRCGCGADL